MVSGEWRGISAVGCVVSGGGGDGPMLFGGFERLCVLEPCLWRSRERGRIGLFPRYNGSLDGSQRKPRRTAVISNYTKELAKRTPGTSSLKFP